MIRRIALAAGLGFLVTLCGFNPAVAEKDAEIGTGPAWFYAGLETETTHESQSAQIAVTDSQITYSYVPVCIRGEGLAGYAFYGCGGQVECGQNGLMFNVVAHQPGAAMTPQGETCVEEGEQSAPVIQQVTQAAVYRAFQRIPLPASEVVIQPPGGETLVNLDTIFSTQADGFTETVGLLGHRVDFDIAPSQFRWVNGDGTAQVTDWAGKPWAKGTPLHEFITHRYDDAATTVQPRVDTTWSAQYRVDGGAWRDVGGTVTITGEPFDLDVLSAEPHLAG